MAKSSIFRGGCGRTFLIAGLAVAPAVFSEPARADPIIWSNGNDAGANPGPVIQEFDTATGALLTSFADPAAVGSSQEGAGIAVVGSKIFYSLDNSTSVFLTNASGANLGTVFTVIIPGVTGIRSIASDGNFLYLTMVSADLSIDENVYKFDFVGNPIGSPLTLVPSGGIVQAPRDGLEIVGDTFVANQPRGDIGPYDQFDATTGSLMTAGFLNTGEFGFTGVAFDGSDYYVFDDEADPSQLVEYDASGAFMQRITLTGLPGPNDQAFLSDLSAVTPAVPEPSTLALLVTALAGLIVWRRRRLRRGDPNAFT